MRSCLLAVLLLCAAARAGAVAVDCHLNYGGETRVVRALPVASPYTAPVIEVGSYFLFRLVFEGRPPAPATIKAYTYANRESGPTLLHQANFPYPPPKTGPRRFSGTHFVHEPLRDGELQYWCELTS